MKFCSHCGTLYALKCDESPPVMDDETEGSPPAPGRRLKYVCNQCGHVEDRTERETCVHSAEMDCEIVTHQISNNPYILRDPTLPRLSNVACIKDSCPTRPQQAIEGEGSSRQWLLVYPPELLEVRSQFEDYSSQSVLSEHLNAHGELHTLHRASVVSKDDLVSNKVNAVILNIPSQSDGPLATYKEGTKPDDTGNFASIYIKALPPPAEEYGSTLFLAPLVNEIISIKYDDIEMKYMYVCSTCGTSWKNQPESST